MLTNLNSHQNFNGYLHVKLAEPEKVKVPKDYLAPEATLIEMRDLTFHRGSVEKLPEVILNTDAIKSVESEHCDLSGKKGYPITSVWMSDNIKYDLNGVDIRDFSHNLVAASQSSTRFIDMII